MKKILKWLDDNIELYICVFLMSFMTLLVFVQVVMRYVFNNSLSWSEELARYTFIWLIYIGISYGCRCTGKMRFLCHTYNKSSRSHNHPRTFFCCTASEISFF